MKALKLLTGEDKAKLLHELFPEEMENLVIYINEFYINEFCAHFSANTEAYRKDWKNGLISFNYWIALSKETAGIISMEKRNLIKSSKLFSEQLYFSCTSLFVTDCIVKFSDQKSENDKSKLMVNAFFK
ncbi:hypothetical protein OQZ33_17070 [Pedobacter sp. MC2016-05]|uniref:hypothetical protein n=1 Tax=Pedobacter sp. MC2016-05 TaxID=2994474 RepID=UPI002247D136|nr:hypothetical protein [Pedobacter sp. MC2016-05]MCX2476048.1 hypothetical protein [Pedobacter sp. MC2016-05]